MPGTDVGSGEIHAMSHMLGCRIGVFSPPLKNFKGGWGWYPNRLHYANAPTILLYNEGHCHFQLVLRCSVDAFVSLVLPSFV